MANTRNNQRFQETDRRIEETFLVLLRTKHVSRITVREVCEGAGITRTSFYAHYSDVYDLLREVEYAVTSQIIPFFTDPVTDKPVISNTSFVKLFHHIRTNKDFYHYYFANTDADQAATIGTIIIQSQEGLLTYPVRLPPSEDAFQKYRLRFFVGGMNAMIKQWLEGDCIDTPEDLARALEAEYLHAPLFA